MPPPPSRFPKLRNIERNRMTGSARFLILRFEVGWFSVRASRWFWSLRRGNEKECSEKENRIAGTKAALVELIRSKKIGKL
jgi:hypothetical protein